MDGSTRTRVLTILAMVLVVSSVGLVAATIDSATVVHAGGGDPAQTTDDQPSRFGDRLNVSVSANESSGNATAEGISLAFCIRTLRSPVAILGIVAVLAALFYLVYRRHNVATTALVSSGVLPVVMFTYFLLTNCPGGGGGGGTLLDGADVMSESGGTQAPSVPPTLLVAAFATLMVAAVALLVRSTSEEETFEAVEEDEEPETADFARAAGRAADRIEEANVDVDNAVYRAWLEMTRLLDIDEPDTAAPRDFAEAAIEVGLDEDDVMELTNLFTEVRYGGKSPDTREERALSVLREIESTYEETVDETGGAER